jgi:hypothetical protein
MASLFTGMNTTLAVPCTDNDVIGLDIDRGSLQPEAVLPNGGGYVVREGTNSTLSLRLRSRPLGPVTVTVQSRSPQRVWPGSEPVLSIPIAVNDWNASHPLAVFPRDNMLEEGPVWVELVGSVAPVSADPFYANLSTIVVPLLVLDDEGGELVQASTPSNISESGLSTNVAIVLGQSIANDSMVTVSFEPAIPSRVTVTPAQLSLNSSQFLQSVFVTISAVDNQIDDDDQLMIVHMRIELDGAVVMQTLAAFWCIDNDMAGLIASKTALTVNETGSPI